MASTYPPTQTNYSNDVFADLTRRVRDDRSGGIDVLNEALGRGIRLILAHRIAEEKVDDALRRVLELAVAHIRSVEIEPSRVPQLVISLIEECTGTRRVISPTCGSIKSDSRVTPVKKAMQALSHDERDAVTSYYSGGGNLDEVLAGTGISAKRFQELRTSLRSVA